MIMYNDKGGMSVLGVAVAIIIAVFVIAVIG